jgi:hypothetical protein
VVWDPFGTLGQVLWIGGGQWVGKSTVARLLAQRYELTAYHYDYHDARGHHERRILARIRRGEPPDGPGPEAEWVHTVPQQMAAETLAGFPERFEWVLDDLRALVTWRPIIAEGWGLRPELVTAIADSPRRMIVLAPSAEFRAYQVRTLPRAAALGQPVSDPELAQRNRLARDELVMHDAVRTARRLGVRVLVVDGRLTVEAVTDMVAEHFSPYLPRPAG